MRTFIAIELSEDIKDALSQAQSHLKYADADVKWVDRNNIHLTLKFLGEVSEEKLEDIKYSLDNIAEATKPFEISVRHIGAFPKIDHAKVLWASLDRGSNEVKAFAAEVDKAMSDLGFTKEARPFAAHLTIGRARPPKNSQALKEKILSYSPSTADCPLQPVNSIAIFKSILTSDGPIYTRMHVSDLG